MILMKYNAGRLRRSLIALAACCALVLAGGCGIPASRTGSATSTGSRVSVVAAFYPLQFVAERVAGDTATVDTLTVPGAEPHDLELTPQQIASLSTADVVIYQKGFQVGLDKAIDEARPAHLIDVSTVARMRTMPESGAVDPHQWLDPDNMAAIAAAVATRLTEVSPADQATFTANAAALKGDLTALSSRFDVLATCARTEFITSHAAFGYLAARYGLTEIGISGLSPDEEPSPARIIEVQAAARKYGITTIFYETLVSPTVARSIAGDLGLTTDVLDPLEGITSASRGNDYIAVMESNLEALKKANSCQ